MTTRDVSTTHKIFENQAAHLLAWVILGVLLFGASRRFPGAAAAPVWGQSAGRWLLVSWIFAALHQGWVWFFWRLELYGGKISAWLGPGGFRLFKVGFVLLAAIRLASIVLVSLASAGTLAMPRRLSLGLIVVSAPFILWGLYSAVAYFGVNRAFGADHFQEKYRGGALERRGLFRYVPNAMYTVVLLALYHPGLLLSSAPGLLAALVHHLLVWTHYFCTERPDMREIFGAR